MTGMAGPPTLRFAVEDASAAECTAVPAVRFALRVENAGDAPVQCVALNTQIRIATARRTYDPETRRRLTEVFGTGDDWTRALGSLLWARTATQVAEFGHVTVAHLDVACTYDFEVAVAKYFHALRDGEVPLEFQFSGTVFYLDDGDLLRAARIPWDAEATYRMPVRVWHEVMERHFPGAAWLRLDREVFDRLYAYRVRHTLGTWERTVTELLAAAGEPAAEAARRGSGGDGD